MWVTSLLRKLPLLEDSHCQIAQRAYQAFDLFAWQFLWVLGVWMGVARATAPEQREPVSRRLLTGAIVASMGFFVVRHLDVDLGDAAVLFDKWSLAPLRLVNFLAVALLASWLAPRLFRWLRPKVLEALGQASLPVFAVHVVLCLLSLSLLDENEDPLDYWDEAAVLVATFCSMYFVALRQRIAGRNMGPPSPS